MSTHPMNIDLEWSETMGRADLLYKDMYIDFDGTVKLGKPFLGKETISPIPGPILAGILYKLNKMAYEKGVADTQRHIRLALGLP